ncbi:GEVED domain-containing protein [Winogradskyella flava]|uniref:GEVED domain-containing protein n=1 Tax=Winogradskyella flava TaxID=1884876 RepID=UPI002490F772|nr:GEVED domain-containing protein [Winogradskyella flava]
MKNTIYSPLYTAYNLCLKAFKKSSLLIFFGVFFFYGNQAHAQLPIFDNFETGFGNWNDGGNDCARLNTTILNGNRVVRLRDNSGGNSSTFSDQIDITSYSSVTIEFLFRTTGFNNTNHDFQVQYNDGSGYVTVADYNYSTNFNNNTTYSASVTLLSTTYTFTNNARFRIRCDAQIDDDILYIDDINITGISSVPCSDPTNQPTNIMFSNVSDTSMDGSFSGASGSPDGYLVVYNTTGVAPTPNDGTSYNIGDTIGAGNVVADNDSNTSFSATGLTSSTTYYFFIYSYNSSSCSGGPSYLTVNPLTGNETTETYCIPVGTNSLRYINDFTTSGGITNINSTGTAFTTGGYADFTSQSASQYYGGTLDFYVNFRGTHGFAIWVDFNNDGDFFDAGEEVYNSNNYVDPLNGSFTIPTSVAAGNYRMRILGDYWDSSPDSPCLLSLNEGEAEDYTLTVLVPPPCSEPIDQPTGLSFSNIADNSMDLTFTPAVSSPDSYLILYNTTGITPTISDGTTYTTGSVFAGNTVASNDSSTSITLTGLTENTTYFFYIFSFNGVCTGGPDYNTANPLSEFETTTGPCSLSSANGTTDLGCPSVDAGGVGLSGGDVTINCNVSDTTLEAVYLELGETTSYTVESIPYNPPFQFGCLANPVSVNQDDVWSPVVNLPFDFCFYGNTYNSCVIGSNGVISFDTGLATLSSGWEILENIPGLNNTDGRYFGPSIFGVHHDVDPSVGGEIGWQLINLDTGCRALVASWADVPMFSRNNILYTGMIVLYEDTNVIEIYIKDKNLVSSWNDGNATIGLQENSTSGTTVPARNSLDSNWFTSSEAWRFVPSGNSITELKWYEGSVTPANEIIDPDDDGEITVNPANTTTYYTEVTYTLCNGSTIVETDATTVTVTGPKTWDGSESNDWHDPDNWTPNGVPTITDCVTIPSTATNPRIYNGADGLGYNMQILDGADLLQQSNSTLTIDDAIIVEPNAGFTVRNNASVIQINNVTSNNNIGDTRVQREVTGVDYFDYVYWSSPVDAFNVEDISPGTPNFAIYEWAPTVANGTAGQHGTWLNTSGNMTLGKGYIVRGLLGGSMASTAEFDGTLNNGVIFVPVSRGTWTGADYAGIGNTATAEDDNWNLMGNPYPSAISLSDFVGTNFLIDGTVYFWRHLNPATAAIDDPFYENYTYNYNPNDYLSANILGSTPAGFNGLIASGQGFFVLLRDTAPTSTFVAFDNTMRSAGNNSQFYRNASSTGDENSEEKHRIWLDLVDQDNMAISTLVGFAEGATDGIDRLYDGFSINKSDKQFYSLESNHKLAIQGKSLPFDGSETIPLGYIIPNPGSYTISINQLDGLFSNENQTIYLEDTELNIVHDLKSNPYSFAADSGTFNERFVLKFNNATLGIDDEEALSNLDIIKANENINVNSSYSNIMSFELFDIKGRLIHKNLNIKNDYYTYKTQNISSGVYIVKVLLENGSIKVKKLIF